MKLLKTLLVVVLAGTNVAQVIAVTEITSAPEMVLASSTNTCLLLANNLSTSSGLLFINETVLLQQFLVANGYLSSDAVTGFYGPLTSAAVAKYQFDNKLITSLSQSGAGQVGPQTRGLIASQSCAITNNNTTGVATSSATLGYSVSLSTKSGVIIDENDSENIMRLGIVPKHQTAKLDSLVIYVESPNTSNPANFIEGFEITKGSTLISRTKGTNIWSTVSGKSNTYKVVLTASENSIAPSEDATFNIKVIPKSSALSGSLKDFYTYIPREGLTVKFRNSSGASIGQATWGNNDSSSSSFAIGRAPQQTTSPIIPTPVATTTATTTTATTTTPVTPTTPTLLPLLNRVTPDEGGFGQALELRGTRLHPTNNRIKIVHGETNSSRMTGILPSKDNKIQFTFPGLNSEFTRFDNGRKVSGQTGGYKVYVIADGKESNWVRYLVRSSANPNEKPVAPYIPLPKAANAPAPTQVPELNLLNPNDGPFGTEFKIRATYLTPGQTNRVKMVHVETGASRVFGPFASSNNMISYRFPGKNTEFTRPNGTKISGKTGSYRVSVINANGESNWLLLKVTQ